MRIKPEIRIWLFSRADVGSVADAVMAAFREDMELAPERFGLFEPYKIDFQSPKALELLQSEARNELSLLGGERKRPVRINLSLLLGMTAARPFHSLYWSADAKVLNSPGAVERIESLFRRLVVAFDAYWGAAYHSEEFERQNVLRDVHHPDGSIQPYRVVGVDLKTALPGLYWLNYFGRSLCDFIGVEAIKAAVPSSEPLGNGLLLRLAESPMEMVDESANEMKQRVKAALGEDLFFDIRQPQRVTRTTPIPAPPPLTPSPVPVVPSIENPTAFVKSAASRAAAWRLKHGVGADRAAALRAMEKELDALGFRAPAEEALADYTAVLGQLVIAEAGGHWVPTEEPHVATSGGLDVYPVSQILKRAVDPDASLVEWLDVATGKATP